MKVEIYEESNGTNGVCQDKELPEEKSQLDKRTTIKKNTAA